jgi:hypothetical protein
MLDQIILVIYNKTLVSLCFAIFQNDLKMCVYILKFASGKIACSLQHLVCLWSTNMNIRINLIYIPAKIVGHN